MDDPLYAFVANGEVVYTRRFPSPPDISVWKPVTKSVPPEFNPETQELVESGWTVTQDSAFQSWQVLDKPVPDSTVVTVFPNYVPDEVPLWAFRAILTVSGLSAQVDALIDALPEPQKTIANTQWQYGNFIVRTHPLIQACGAQLGMTREQIDDVFRQASLLK